MPEHSPYQLVYLVYGDNPNYRLEAKFSMLSAIRHGCHPRILLYTDRPADYEGWPICVKETDLSTLKDWTGVNGYIHKRKACAFADALQYADTSIFIDTDTFFTASPGRLIHRLSKAQWLVDKTEARFGDWSHLPLYKKTASYLKESQGVKDDLLMINSGVLGLRRQQQEIVNSSVEMIDDLCLRAPGIHIIEQFAVAVAARRLGKPAEAKGIVCHYYSEKEYWRAVIGTFFSIHGEHWRTNLPEISREAPTTRPKPDWWFRLALKAKSLFLPKASRRFARMAYYATHMPDNVYAKSCCQEYCDAMRKASPALTKQLQSGNLPNRWRVVLNLESQAALSRMLDPIWSERSVK
ncbi:MAG: hypothetical protein KAX55_03220 [Propionivibrio sp.]|nr:hypothetical protein [Propionivibrio sp.]